ncbi:MAG: LamG-like jellyroll fold domain-containing protein [Nannocystaceae bacterium]
MFACTDDAECGAGGSCEGDGCCAATDDGCDSGLRWSRYAPADIAGHCVAPTGTSDGGASSSTTAALEGTGGSTTAAITTTLGSGGDTTSEGSASSGGDTTTGSTSACVPEGRAPVVPVLLYDFCEGDGTTVSSIVGDPFPLDFEDAGAPGVLGQGFTWVADGLRLDGDWEGAHTGLRSREPVFERLDDCRDGGELTVEVWATPLDDSQGGPTGIVTYGSPPGGQQIEFALAMNPEWTTRGYVGMLHTTDAMIELDWLDTPMLRASHLVLVHRTGETTLFLDGEVIATNAEPGDLSVWNPNYDLVFGNFPDYDVRNWRGTLHLVAIYCEALASEAITANFDAGPRPR